MSAPFSHRSFFQVFADFNDAFLGGPSEHTTTAPPAAGQCVHTNLGLGVYTEEADGHATLHLDWPVSKVVPWTEVTSWEELSTFVERVRAQVETLDAAPFSSQTQCALMWAHQALRRAARYLNDPAATSPAPRWPQRLLMN
ncbi:MAG: hypothetical protein AAGI71_06300 [Bacteroidota bacterium]